MNQARNREEDPAAEEKAGIMIPGSKVEGKGGIKRSWSSAGQ